MSEQTDARIITRAAHILRVGMQTCRRGSIVSAGCSAGKIKMLAEGVDDLKIAIRVNEAGHRLFVAAIDKLYRKVE